MMKLILLLAAFVAAAAGETVHGVVVFSRHGDRTTKHFKGYRMTNLGFDQVFSSGSLYRNRYISSSATNPILGISSDVWQSKQIYASAPDQEVLLNTATAFLQGLYPPVNNQISVQDLNNGTATQAPLGGYQYVVLHSELVNSPDTIWLKGADGCPAYTTSAASYNTTSEYKTLRNETFSFYQQFDDLLTNLYPNSSQLSYANAYDVFDLLNVGLIHNSSLTGKVSSEQLYQLRTLADRSEFNRNYAADDEIRSVGGQTFASIVLSQLNQTITSNATLKLSLLAGSYDTFLSFFGLANLTAVSTDFYGLPDYASTMAFELFTADNVTAFPSSQDDLRVRFLFRNGSSTDLNVFPLFGEAANDYSYPDFVSKMSSIALNSVSTWCSKCQSADVFCTSDSVSSGPAITAQRLGSHLSNAAAGAIGAAVTLAVVFLCGLAFMALRKHLFRKRSPVVVAPVHTGKDIEKASTSGSSR